MTEATKPRGRGRPKDEALDQLIERFLALKIGHSVFFADLTCADVAFLRKPILAAGANLHMTYTLDDTIYGTPGTRVWRQAGDYDEL